MRHGRPRRGGRALPLAVAVALVGLACLVPRAVSGGFARPEPEPAPATAGEAEGGSEGDAGAASGGALGGAAEGIGTTVVRRELAPADAAAELLEGYRAEGGCALVCADWLDLFGNTWGCVVSGDGWTDLCLVSGVGDDGEASEVRVTRLEAEGWEDVDGMG